MCRPAILQEKSMLNFAFSLLCQRCHLGNSHFSGCAIAVKPHSHACYCEKPKYIYPSGIDYSLEISIYSFDYYCRELLSCQLVLWFHSIPFILSGLNYVVTTCVQDRNLGIDSMKCQSTNTTQFYVTCCCFVNIPRNSFCSISDCYHVCTWTITMTENATHMIAWTSIFPLRFMTSKYNVLHVLPMTFLLRICHESHFCKTHSKLLLYLTS